MYTKSAQRLQPGEDAQPSSSHWLQARRNVKVEELAGPNLYPVRPRCAPATGDAARSRSSIYVANSSRENKVFSGVRTVQIDF